MPTFTAAAALRVKDMTLALLGCGNSLTEHFLPEYSMEMICDPGLGRARLSLFPA